MKSHHILQIWVKHHSYIVFVEFRITSYVDTRYYLVKHQPKARMLIDEAVLVQADSHHYNDP